MTHYRIYNHALQQWYVRDGSWGIEPHLIKTEDTVKKILKGMQGDPDFNANEVEVVFYELVETGDAPARQFLEAK